MKVLLPLSLSVYSCAMQEMGTNIVLVNRTETEQLRMCLQLGNVRTDDYNSSSQPRTGTGDEYWDGRETPINQLKTSNS